MKKGSVTVEIAIIVPVVLWVLTMLIILMLYYHDKNVVAALAHEAVVVADKGESTCARDVEEYFQSRVSNKLLLFSKVDSHVQMDDNTIYIVCKAKKKKMTLHIKLQMKRTKPEEYVRKLLWMEKKKE